MPLLGKVLPRCVDLIIKGKVGRTNEVLLF